jgi:hypothetical protein
MGLLPRRPDVPSLFLSAETGCKAQVLPGNRKLREKLAVKSLPQKWSETLTYPPLAKAYANRAVFPGKHKWRI